MSRHIRYVGKRRDKAAVVLAGLQCAETQDERLMSQLVSATDALIFTTLFLTREASVYTAVEHCDLFGRDLVQLDQILPRSL